jgi:hypothetical protein
MESLGWVSGMSYRMELYDGVMMELYDGVT